ncbi:olfactory receptor 6C76-like [Tachyglossus aculeatus]|uniref:olfactory receptor 6C76-like n=1 Tax=Tachyglossus aculeatus TaxID=9261 RepID=UPI0018F762D1|nr:olfactory receptor 6C76-like [Tachyglossus aculeatus]
MWSGIDEYVTRCDPGGNPESAMRNQTSVTEFILLGLTDNPDWKNVIFLFLLLSYLLSITGNLTILTPILLDSHLHTPITISYNACVIQFFFIIFLGEAEIVLLDAMSYYSYVAICRPLHYLTIMCRRVCTLLVLCSWLVSFLIIFTGLILDLQLNFCDSKVINHSPVTLPMLDLSCIDTQLFEQMNFILAVGTLLQLHIHAHQPSPKEGLDFNKRVPVPNISLALMLNPFIYTL